MPGGSGTEFQLSSYGDMQAREVAMQKSSDAMRQSAENCDEMARETASEPERKRLKRLAEGWQEVAKNQDWLDGQPEEPSPEAV